MVRGKTPFESCVTLRQYAPFEEGPRSQSILLHGQSDTLHIRFVTLFGITVALLRSGLVRNESVHNAAMLALLSRLRFLHVLGIFMARQRKRRRAMMTIAFITLQSSLYKIQEKASKSILSKKIVVHGRYRLIPNTSRQLQKSGKNSRQNCIYT